MFYLPSDSFFFIILLLSNTQINYPNESTCLLKTRSLVSFLIEMNYLSPIILQFVVPIHRWHPVKSKFKALFPLCSDKDKIISNHQVGHMLRTKLSHVNEGGVAAGLGALDSVFLVDMEKCCEGPCTDLDGCCQKQREKNCCA